MFVDSIETPIGRLWVGIEGGTLRRVSFEEIGGLESDDPLLKRILEDLRRYFRGERVDFEWIRIDYGGLTPFEIKVLKTLREIPYGSLISYWELSLKAGFPNSQRAVGNVLRKNPFPLIVPCHRVIRKNGELGGYQKGVSKKAFLIELERRGAVDRVERKSVL
jgi:methylated-DNA-[protein]-cysteine S-methyltransferase